MDEDNFDEFGGFEEAEAIPPSVASQPSTVFGASSGPWAFLDNQLPAQQAQPDILMAQDTFPLCLEKPGGHDLFMNQQAAGTFPGDVLDEYGGSGLVGSNSIAGNLDVSDDDEYLHQCNFGINDPDLINRILDGTLTSALPQQSFTHVSTDSTEPTTIEPLPSINVDVLRRSTAEGVPPNVDGEDDHARTIRNSENVDYSKIHSENDKNPSNEAAERVKEEQTSGLLEDSLVTNNISESDIPVVKGEESETTNRDWSSREYDDIEWIVRSVLLDDSDDVPISDEKETPRQATTAAVGSKNILSLQTGLQSQLEREIQDFKVKNEELEDVVSQCRADLQTQKEKYYELQEKHGQELQSIREASHSTLTIISEQHQEAMTLALLEQQAAFQEKLNTITSHLLEDSAKRLNEQREDFLRTLDEERLKREEELRVSLAQFQTQITDMVEKVTSEQRLQELTKLDETVKEVSHKNEEAIETALNEERIRITEMVKSQKLEIMKALHEKNEELQNQVQKALEAFTLEHKNTLHEAVREERERRTETDRTAIDVAKSEVKDYLEELAQNSRSRYTRQMASLDLFLRSAQQQLDHMMTSSQESPIDDH